MLLDLGPREGKLAAHAQYAKSLLLGPIGVDIFPFSFIIFCLRFFVHYTFLEMIRTVQRRNATQFLDQGAHMFDLSSMEREH